MNLRTCILAAALSLPAALAMAQDSAITITDTYARSGAKSGAVFFVIQNAGTADDTLTAAQSDVARKTELHTHQMDANGVMKMREIEGGIAIPAGGSHALRRGGDHVMLMGLDAPLQDGETISLSLEFEQAGTVTLEVPVDNQR